MQWLSLFFFFILLIYFFFFDSYKVCSKSNKTKASRNKWNINFLQRYPQYIQLTYSSKLQLVEAPIKTPFWYSVKLHHCNAFNVLWAYLIHEFTVQETRKNYIKGSLVSMESAALTQSCVSFTYMILSKVYMALWHKLFICHIAGSWRLSHDFLSHTQQSGKIRFLQNPLTFYDN